jgi:hypothetical protein
MMRGPRPWPPPPHDPGDRVVRLRLDGWDLRNFPRTDERWAYFATHGFAHVQLWHPEALLSVLTPSRLTAGRFEAFPIAGWKFATRDYTDLCEIIHREHALEPPPEGLLQRALDLC